MTLQSAPSDINIITPFCREVYRRCREVGGDFEDVGRDTFALHGVLKQLKSEYSDAKSPLHTDLSLLARKLVPLIHESNTTLLLLDGLLEGRKRRASNDHNSASPVRPVVERQSTFLSLTPSDQLMALRAKILSHKTSLALLHDNIQLHASRRDPVVAGEDATELEAILDEVDSIAARLSRETIANGGTTTERSLWRRIRDELLEHGFTHDALQQHKDSLRAYIHELDHEGRPAAATQEPLEAFPAFNSTDKSTIEIPQMTLCDGENASPQSRDNMRDPREECRPLKPRAQTDFQIPRLMKEHMSVTREDARYPTPLTIPASPQPNADYYTLITPEMFAEDLLYSADHSGSEATDAHKVRAGEPLPSKIIETNDLSQDLAISPRSPEASSYFDNQDATLPLNGITGLGISVPSVDPMSLPTISSMPGPEVILPNARAREKAERKKKLRLAPDSTGQPIAANAKWTRIKRSLVSPEVLRQEGRRFEANPEFVAVLGELTREEIQEYAMRSLALREARWSRPRPQIPRAFTYQVPRPMSGGNASSGNMGSGNMSTSPQPQTAAYPSTQWRGGQPTPSPEGKSDSDGEQEKERDEGIKNIRSILSRQHQTFSAGSSTAPRVMRRTSYQSQTGWPNAHGSPATKRFSGERSSTVGGTSTDNASPNSTVMPKSPTLSPVLGPSALQLPSGGLNRTTSMMNLGTGKVRDPGSPRLGVTFAEEVTVSTTEDIDKAREAARKEAKGGDTSPPERRLKRWKTTYKEQGIGGTAIKLVNVLTDRAGI